MYVLNVMYMSRSSSSFRQIVFCLLFLTINFKSFFISFQFSLFAIFFFSFFFVCLVENVRVIPKLFMLMLLLVAYFCFEHFPCTCTFYSSAFGLADKFSSRGLAAPKIVAACFVSANAFIGSVTVRGFNTNLGRSASSVKKKNQTCSF